MTSELLNGIHVHVHEGALYLPPASMDLIIREWGVQGFPLPEIFNVHMYIEPSFHNFFLSITKSPIGLKKKKKIKIVPPQKILPYLCIQGYHEEKVPIYYIVHLLGTC